MKKNLILGVLLITAITSGCTTMNKTSDASSVDSPPVLENKLPDDATFEEHLAGMNFLTKEEKQRLIDSEKEKDPYYDEIETLSSQAEEIQIRLEGKKEEQFTEKETALKDQEEQIHQQMEALYQKIQVIDDKNADLWEKISENAKPIPVPYK